MTHKLALALALAPAAVLAQAPFRAILAQEPQESPYELKSQFASDGTQEIFDLGSGAAPGSTRAVPGEHALRLPERSFADEEDPADARRLSTTVFTPDNAELNTAVGDWIKDSGDAEAQYGPISEWDVSKVTDMRGKFYGATDFNAPIGAWDVSKVKDMHRAFAQGQAGGAFDADIGAWDVSEVTDMSNAFRYADAFDADLRAWDVSKVTNMEMTFEEAAAFNQDIGGWDCLLYTSPSPRDRG